MKKFIIVILMIVCVKSYAQLSFQIDSVILYTIDDIPLKLRDGGLDFYDNIQKYGPYLEVYGRVRNDGERDTTLVSGWSDNFGGENYKWEEFYVSFHFKRKPYKTCCFYARLDDNPTIDSRRIKNGNHYHDVISPGESVTCHFYSHFLYRTPFFRKKKTEWRLSEYQSRRLARIAKEAIENGLEISVESVACAQKDR
ncbi:hypothetical protein SAMN06298215_1157 [Bacteroidales bacterium WCE2008]|nr:hypothetical protein [Bacteroidales bacterium]SKC48222.1 hypothetical protein SAMN06298215_1157 [Bacteroidales bacterium WCE2008]